MTATIQRNRRIALRLGSVRMKHMLDQARAIVELCADGREKLTGAYIFDRHYIYSLVDKIIELSREMVFDASVIAPAGIRTCYSVFDSCKAAAEQHFIENGKPPDDDVAAEPDDGGFEKTVEYRLLQRALQWIGCPEDKPRVSVIGLLDRVLHHVLDAVAKNAVFAAMPCRLDIPCTGVIHRIACMDMDGATGSGEAPPASFDDLGCRPLSLLADSACAGADPAPESADRSARDWLALAGSHELSLLSTASGPPVWLDVDLAEDDTGYVLLWCADGRVGADDMPADCRTTLPSGEILLWKAGWQDADLSRVLTALAAILLGGKQ